MKNSILNPTSQAIAGAQSNLVLIAIDGGIWACAPVSERPELTLTDWHVFEVQLPGSAEPTRHFTGYNLTDREGRASSAIATFDATTGRGVTESGRVYELRGGSGFNLDGEYVWNRWKAINGVTDALDVTAEIKLLIESKS